MSTCTKNEQLHDYAFDEIPAVDKPAFERHLATCADCTAELDQLRLTTAALRVLPDREPPQRIAFVSDKVFQPSPFRNLIPWLGFASAALMAAALIVSTYNRPVEIRTVVTKTEPSADTIDSAIARVHEEDTRIFKASLASTLAAMEAKHEKERLAMVDAIQVMQSHQYVAMTSANETNGSGQ